MKLGETGQIVNLLFIILCTMLLSSCGTKRSGSSRPQRIGYFEPVSFQHVPNWSSDKHLDAFHVFQKSCNRILKEQRSPYISSTTELGAKWSDWAPICKEAVYNGHEINNSITARIFFERWFQPYKVLKQDGADRGKMTGYYEISMRGSRHKTSKYKYPIYKKPSNLSQIKGSSMLLHKAINNGSLSGKGLEIAWVDNQARRFFMQIQGSGIVILDNGGTIKLAYAEQNGYPYKAIGPEFRKYKTGKIDSALGMIDWLHKNPRMCNKIIEENKSYVFFREVFGDSPIGAQSVALTPHRSIAIDKYFYPYGAPIWIDTTLPRTKSYSSRSFTRLHIAQDTGGAIRGPVRADLFFGRGKKAEERACYMNQMGGMFVLFPKTANIPKKYDTSASH